MAIMRATGAARVPGRLFRRAPIRRLPFTVPIPAAHVRTASSAPNNPDSEIACQSLQNKEKKSPEEPTYPETPFPGVVNWSLSIANTGDPITSYEIFGYPPDPPQPAEADLDFSTVNRDDLWKIPAPSHFLLFGPVGYPAPPESHAAPSDSANMASDEDYSAFLDKASADRSGSTGAQSKSSAGKAQHIRVTTSEIPKVLEKVNVDYVSDADEPFEPVSLTRESSTSGPLTTAELKKLIGAKAQVDTLEFKDFDPKGQYEAVAKAVADAAGKGSDVKVWKVDAGGARVEYWVLAVSSDAKTILGLKATAIES